MSRHVESARALVLACGWLCLLLALPVVARGLEKDPKLPFARAGDDLTHLSLEELMQLNVLDKQVTSVSGSKQRVADAPAAVTVITADDIHRSGLASIPEILRLAPGLDVAQINGNEWAISSRGFSAMFANKLLVLQDGRTLYNRGFSGIFWSMQDAVLDDIDQIEVIRGPGATIWGANAVNGVINITSKDARDTQGVLADTRIGTDEQTESLRYGGRISDNTYYRVYAKYRLAGDHIYSDQVRGGAPTVEAGSDAHDGWHDARGGFRIDQHADAQSHMMVEGEVATGQTNNTGTQAQFTRPLEKAVDYTSNLDSAHILARWTHADGEGSEYSVQGYYDHLQYLNDFLTGYHQDTLDLEFRHRFLPIKGHELIWGVDGRTISDRITASEQLMADPVADTSLMLSAFVQDCWTVIPERLRLYAGSKFEVNNYSGFEYQPSARVLWTPDSRQSAWLGISRAVRTPSRGEEDTVYRFESSPTPLGIPAVATFRGNPGMESEDLLAYEIGYRVKPAEWLSFDVTGFVNAYDNLATSRFYTPEMSLTPSPHLNVPVTRANDMSGTTYGAETSVNWRVTDAWRLSASYTWLTMEMHEAGSGNSDELELEGSIPHNQSQVHSYWDITKDVSINASVYYTDPLERHRIPAYLRTDVNVSWRPCKGVELIIGGSNLFDSWHPEWIEVSGKSVDTEVPRTFYGQLVLHF